MFPELSPEGSWSIEFFERSSGDGTEGQCPTIDFLDSVPDQVAAEAQAVLEAVASGPPHKFRGGGKWEIMHGEMSGIFEIRISYGGFNYRLFCLLVRDLEQLQGPTIVCLGGLTKPKRKGASDKDYRLIMSYRDEFLKNGRVRN